MSSLTSCNYCTLKRIKIDAAREGNKVILRGSDVFVIPAEMEELPPYKSPSDKLPNGDKVYEKYHKAWLMDIPKFCCC